MSNSIIFGYLLLAISSILIVWFVKKITSDAIN